MQIHGRIYVVPRPSGFVHQHLAPSVGNDTKSYVGSLSNFHLHRESAKSARTQNVTPSKTRTQPRDDDTAVADLDADGGFFSLEGMSQWAMGHSDPVQLKEKARDVERLSPTDLNDRRLAIKQLTDELKTPSNTQLMQIAIDDLSNFSLSLEDQHCALEELVLQQIH
ncbi:hypothetical protein ACFXTO_023271 [Malus domestica]